MEQAAAKRVRTCVACGAKKDKVSLHRIVRTKDGAVKYDQTGRLAGRGAYVCSEACLKKALAAGKLGRALRANLDADQAEQLQSEMAGL